MPRTKTAPAAPAAPPTPPESFDHGEAAGRLNVVIQMLQAHADDCPARPWNAKDTGGYELSIMRDVLEEVRDSLWKVERA